MIDSYCERTAEGLWNEPVNALSNLAFIVAGILLWKFYRQQGLDKSWAERLLSLHLFLIGIGSFLFHTFANSVTLWLDVLPILSFQLIWLHVYSERLLGCSRLQSALAVLGYLLLSFSLALLPDPTDGSVGYLAPLAVIAGLGLHYRKQGFARPNLLLQVAALFLVSLSFRTVDLWLCPYWPLGSHFLWHCLNALVLYGVAVTLSAEKGRKVSSG